MDHKFMVYTGFLREKASVICALFMDTKKVGKRTICTGSCKDPLL